MMEIKQEKKGDVLVFALYGELVGGEWTKSFQDRIHEAVSRETSNVVVNMKDVKWMDASGLGLLMACLTTLRSNSGDLKLASVSDRIRRPIEVTKLDKVLRMYASVDEAVDSFAKQGGEK